MSTPQKTRNSSAGPQQPDNWVKMFPAKVESQQQSLVYVKKLLSVGLSTISYLRSMFPEEAYARRNLNGLKLMILK